MTAEVKDYEVTEARFIEGQHRKTGETVQMTVRGAKYYVGPHGDGLKPFNGRVEKMPGVDDLKSKKTRKHAAAKAVAKPGE